MLCYSTLQCWEALWMSWIKTRSLILRLLIQLPDYRKIWYSLLYIPMQSSWSSGYVLGMSVSWLKDRHQKSFWTPEEMSSKFSFWIKKSDPRVDQLILRSRSPTSMMFNNRTHKFNIQWGNPRPWSAAEKEDIIVEGLNLISLAPY